MLACFHTLRLIELTNYIARPCAVSRRLWIKRNHRVIFSTNKFKILWIPVYLIMKLSWYFNSTITVHYHSYHCIVQITVPKKLKCEGYRYGYWDPWKTHLNHSGQEVKNIDFKNFGTDFLGDIKWDHHLALNIENRISYWFVGIRYSCILNNTSHLQYTSGGTS